MFPVYQQTCQERDVFCLKLLRLIYYSEDINVRGHPTWGKDIPSLRQRFSSENSQMLLSWKQCGDRFVQTQTEARKKGMTQRLIFEISRAHQVWLFSEVYKRCDQSADPPVGFWKPRFYPPALESGFCFHCPSSMRGEAPRGSRGLQTSALSREKRT